jgi:hypothetical protein
MGCASAAYRLRSCATDGTVNIPKNAYHTSPVILKLRLLLLPSFSLSRCSSLASNSSAPPEERRQ